VWSWIVAGVVVGIVCAAQAAHAGCKKGAPLFRVETMPLAGGDRVILEVRTSGAWTEGETTGCLSKARLAAVKKAVKAAHFRNSVDFDPCDVDPTTNVYYEGADVWVEGSRPCGRTIDEGTVAAETCLGAAVDAALDDPEVTRRCRAATKSARPFCEGGDVLFSQHMYLSAMEVMGTTRHGTEFVPQEDVPIWNIEVRESGAWSRSDGASLDGGCLSAARRKQLRKAVEKAQFRSTSFESCTDYLGTVIEYVSGKQELLVGATCGEQPDAGTAAAAKCLDAVTDGHSTDAQVKAACR
jgi:hypothetical protein